MAASDVGRHLLCCRTINIITYFDGSDVNIYMQKS